MGNSSSTKAHMETAQKTGTLGLANCGLNKLPDGLDKLKANLRTLDVSGNKLNKPDSFPPCLSQFQMMKTLVMVGCELVELPEGIFSMKKLETLNVSNNKIKSLTSKVGQLKSLKSLNITNNSIQSLPDSLPQCKNLEVIEASYNILQSLPTGLGQLNIQELNANRNRLSDIPAELKNCPRLKILRLEENCLSLNDNLRTILGDSGVSLICLEGNLITQKELDNTEEYKKYMERFTATKKKIF
ncbi:leucine-rich repeat-containing protein 57-like [Symsagittifera roscoffensis]|uniref:leucine-rich repeat-containing protein 57-like n=1 Tax=Symsagittifera roscoffensis TaxID=84072 RepID=UPI00307C6436